MQSIAQNGSEPNKINVSSPINTVNSVGLGYTLGTRVVGGKKFKTIIIPTPTGVENLLVAELANRLKIPITTMHCRIRRGAPLADLYAVSCRKPPPAREGSAPVNSKSKGISDTAKMLAERQQSRLMGSYLTTMFPAYSRPTAGSRAG